MPLSTYVDFEILCSSARLPLRAHHVARSRLEAIAMRARPTFCVALFVFRNALFSY
jgi:hypothetical protein